ncbi:low-density lipoprotein receptor-related protein 4-like [Mytilus californianus]|uniref:low-density lipoprotein receptor-related protein 4-like n=1 Tax=Mytilus californianus TaxID=6549 RepID=UPI002245B541|nr:low-density lipoprotein receptor-related protein 4-like [Mytilus californianus]
MFTILSSIILSFYLVELKFGNGEDTTLGSCSFSGIGPQLLFSNGTHVFSKDLDSNNLRILVETMDSSVIYVDYDLIDGYIYWSDLDTNTISRRRCRSGNEKSDKEVIVQQQTNSRPIGIAVDSQNGHLYWADQDGGPIRRSDFDGSNVVDILNESLEKPTTITIDISNRWLYFSDHGKHTIERCTFDGSSRQILISNDVISPYGLALDMDSKRLYWTDSALYHIKSSKFDGSDVKTLSIDVTPLGNIGIVVMGIDLYGSYMYASNINTGIYRIQKNKIHAVPERVFAIEQDALIYGVKIIKSHTNNATNEKGHVGQMQILFAGMIFVEVLLNRM